MSAAFPKQNLSPFQTKNRPVYCLNFYGVDGVRQNKSLGTRDQTEAKTIAVLIQTPQTHGFVLLSPAISSGYQLFHSKAALTRGPPSLS